MDLNDPQNPNFLTDDSDSEERIEFWQRATQNDPNPGFFHNLGRYYPDFLWPTNYLKFAAFVLTLTLFDIFVRGYFDLDMKSNEQWKIQFGKTLTFGIILTSTASLFYHFCKLLYRCIRNLVGQ